MAGPGRNMGGTMARVKSRLNGSVQSCAQGRYGAFTGMAMSEETESPKRRAILAAATDLFAARGYGAVSMEAIARAADVSKATLYAHFESKDRLFATIVRVACQENILASIEPAYDPPNGEPNAGPDGDMDIGAVLRGIGGRILRFFLAPRTLAIQRLVVAESVRFPELGLAFYVNGPAASRARLAAWMAAQASLCVPEPDVAADQFLGLLRTGLFNRATMGIGPAPDEAEIDAAIAAAVGSFLRAFGSAAG